MITVVNYDRYQDARLYGGQRSDTKATNGPPENDQRYDTETTNQRPTVDHIRIKESSNQEILKEPAAPNGRAASPKKRDAFADYCFEAWRSRHGQAPPWGQREYVNLAAARKRFAEPGGEERARAAWGRYLEAEDDYHAGHGPGKFLADLSRWSVDPDPPSTAISRHNKRLLESMFPDTKLLEGPKS
jgi:hypothetical protein